MRGLGRAVAILKDDQGALQDFDLPNGGREDGLSIDSRDGAMAEAQQGIVQQVIDLIVGKGRFVGHFGVIAHGDH